MGSCPKDCVLAAAADGAGYQGGWASSRHDLELESAGSLGRLRSQPTFERILLLPRRKALASAFQGNANGPAGNNAMGGAIFRPATSSQGPTGGTCAQAHEEELLERGIQLFVQRPASAEGLPSRDQVGR